MAASKGIPGLVTPYTTSEFSAMVEEARAHHYAVSDQYGIVASELRRQLGKVKGAQIMNLDSKVAARRVSRQLIRAANYEAYAARATIRSFQLYQQLFLGKGSSARARGFDINK